MEDIRDPKRLRRELVDWIRDTVEGAGLRGAVFGVSGGVDSAVVCGLAVDALGAERCLGVAMPIESAEEDLRLAHDVADRFGVRLIEQDLSDPFRRLLAALEAKAPKSEEAPTSPDAGHPGPAARLAQANVKPRLRMITVYYYANLLGRMVLGTGNRAEFTLGYFTKWGDGAADAFPLAGLLKHEVWALARELGVPDAVVERAPTAGLWTGQTDEEELGMSYEQVDRFLATGSSGDPAVDDEIRRRERGSRHKVDSPPSPDLS